MRERAANCVPATGTAACAAVGAAAFLQQECSAFLIAPQSPAMRLQQAISGAVICESALTHAKLGVVASIATNIITQIDRMTPTPLKNTPTRDVELEI